MKPPRQHTEQYKSKRLNTTTCPAARAPPITVVAFLIYRTRILLLQAEQHRDPRAFDLVMIRILFACPCRFKWVRVFPRCLITRARSALASLIAALNGKRIFVSVNVCVLGVGEESVVRVYILVLALTLWSEYRKNLGIQARHDRNIAKRKVKSHDSIWEVDTKY